MIQPNDKISREIDIFDKSPAQLSNKEDLCISASSSLPDKKKAMSLSIKFKLYAFKTNVIS